MKFEYFPDDITRALIEIAHIDDDSIDYDNVVSAIYDLKAICENPYNASYYRDFYKLLERVTQEFERR